MMKISITEGDIRNMTSAIVSRLISEGLEDSPFKKASDIFEYLSKLPEGCIIVKDGPIYEKVFAYAWAIDGDTIVPEEFRPEEIYKRLKGNDGTLCQCFLEEHDGIKIKFDFGRMSTIDFGRWRKKTLKKILSFAGKDESASKLYYAVVRVTFDYLGRYNDDE